MRSYLVALILVFSINVFGQVSYQDLVNDFKEIVYVSGFQGSVAISEHGKIIFEHSSGLSDIVNGVQNELYTRYIYASMGKMFTGVAVMQLIEGGKLKVDSKLSDVLPDYPNQQIAKRINIHHLLTHTSGITGLFQMSSD